MEQFRIHDGYDPQFLDAIMEVHNKTELKRTDKKRTGEALAASFAVVTCWSGTRLVGSGRMLSDGKMYASIFDVVVDPEFQGKGVGKMIMQTLIAKAPECSIHLTSTFGNEAFYYKLGFRKHKTAMSLYPERLAKTPYLDREWQP